MPALDREQIVCEDNVKFILIFVGFIFSYILLYIGPTFFLGAEEMRSGPDIPTIIPIGADLVRNAKRCTVLLSPSGDVSSTLNFTPFWVLLFGMMGKLSDTTGRLLFAGASLLSYICSCLYLPRWFSGNTHFSRVSIFVMTVGLTSYGLQFDLERAQWNLPTIFLCLSAVVLSQHADRKQRLFGYFIFTVAIHLKLWPIFFAICFIRPTDGWRANVKRQLGLLLLNFSFLFVLGPWFFLKYITSIGSTISASKNFWSGNHSIASFSYIMNERFGNGFTVAITFYCISLICFATLLTITFLKNHRRVDPFVILTCTLAAMLLPNISHDYKLVILTVTMSVFFTVYKFAGKPGSMIYRFESAGLLAMSFIYSVSLYANWRKRLLGLFTPNTPLLLGLVMLCLGLVILQHLGTNKNHDLDKEALARS